MSTPDAIRFEIDEEAVTGTRIKVIGVGGGGSNAVARMMQQKLPGVEFHIFNTDQQALTASPVPGKLAIGGKITRGLGAGSDPNVGRQAALEDTERIIEILEGADMVFVAAGMGGGTGTGAAPVVASLAKELGALTIAVVTTPFEFEGPRRIRQAERGLQELAVTVDTVITVPNNRLLELAAPGTSFLDAFAVADDVLSQAVGGMADIIATTGVINRDFSDIRSIMVGAGYAAMSSASARGEDAAVQAARKALSSPLIDDVGIRGARGVLINLTGPRSVTLHDINEACSLIRAATENEDVQVNFGMVLNEAMESEVKITIIATGFQRESLHQQPGDHDRRPPVSAHEEQPPRLAAAAVAHGFPATPPPITIAMEPTPEPVYYEPQAVEPPSDAPAAGSSQKDDESGSRMRDLDTPAFLRRERRLFH